MIKSSTRPKMKKELKLFDVFAIATGTTLSAGFFLLPGIAAAQAGPAMILAYMLAAIPLIPATFSIVELATAMPRAGGVYYFLDRTLGPYMGTIGGLGTWLALILKVTFALVGMGAYVNLFFPNVQMLPIALVFAIALGIVNIFGAKKGSSFQIFLVLGLLAILIAFVTGGMASINYSNFNNFFGSGFNSLLSTTGLVYISYVGVTKIASLSEEIKDPEKNLPKGVFLALGTSFLIYGLGTAVMVGVIPMKILSNDLTPVATAAELIMGTPGKILVSIAALFAFISVANAGIMSASRYPLAMSRDHLLPRKFQLLGKWQTPSTSIFYTVATIILILLILDPTKIAKLASAFQLMMFAFVCLAVIVMRESRIDSYDPGYKSPFYPWTQIIGIITAFWLIIEMGWLPTIFSLSLILISTIWYFKYVRGKVARTGAIYHIFERLGHSRNKKLDSELREILKEKGLRAEDPFEEIVIHSQVFDLQEKLFFEDVVDKVSDYLKNLIPYSKKEISDLFIEGTRIGATPVAHGVALPHFRSESVEQTHLVLVRAKNGVNLTVYDPLSHEETECTTVKALFFLVSPEKNPGRHLRILAQIASKIDNENFLNEFYIAKNTQEIREALIHDDRCITIELKPNSTTSDLIEHQIKDIEFPETALVAWIRRNESIFIPKGNIKLQSGDRLTIIGDPKAIKTLTDKYLKR